MKTKEQHQRIHVCKIMHLNVNECISGFKCGTEMDIEQATYLRIVCLLFDGACSSDVINSCLHWFCLHYSRAHIASHNFSNTPTLSYAVFLTYSRPGL